MKIKPKRLCPCGASSMSVYTDRDKTSKTKMVSVRCHSCQAIGAGTSVREALASIQKGAALCGCGGIQLIVTTAKDDSCEMIFAQCARCSATGRGKAFDDALENLKNKTGGKF